MWEIITGLTIILFGFYKWIMWSYDYWKKNGVAYVKPTFLFGNAKDLVLLKKHAGEVYSDFYWAYPDEPAVGIYNLLTPELVLRDSGLIKTALIKEFNSFHDNIFVLDPSVDIIANSNPFIAKGDRWKTLRTFHTHTQSSGKIKAMFPLMLDVCKDMSQYVTENIGNPIEARYFTGQYTTDVVASCVCGLRTNSFTDPNAEFRKMSAKIFQEGFKLNLFFVINRFLPKLVTLLKLQLISTEVNDFFVKVIKDLCEYRTENKVSRNDFVQTMLDENLKSDTPKYTYKEITAHMMTFFIDGYETSATLMSFAIYLLAVHPECQNRLRDEVSEVKELSYEAVHGFKYLEAVINETLRMYPPGLALSRKCTEDIVLKSGDKTYPIKKGMIVSIPVFAMHRDPNIFPDPEEFMPDRFFEQQAPPEFLPFGLGPRACLGSRFALTQIKAGLSYLIRNFQITPRDSEIKPIKLDNNQLFLMTPKAGLWVKFEKIQDE